MAVPSGPQSSQTQTFIESSLIKTMPLENYTLATRFISDTNMQHIPNETKFLPLSNHLNLRIPRSDKNPVYPYIPSTS